MAVCSQQFNGFFFKHEIIPIIIAFCICFTGGIGINKTDRLVMTNCEYIFGHINKQYDNLVSQSRPVSYVFFVERHYVLRSHVSDSESKQTTNLRIEAGTNFNASLQYPVMFIVRQQKSLTSLEVPAESEIGQGAKMPTTTSPRYVHYYASRTLCIDDATEADKRYGGRNVTVRVTTQSIVPVHFHISLKLTEDFQLPLGREIAIDVSPTEPKFYSFSFSRPDLDQVKIRTTSGTSECVTISVQSPQCPVYDLERNVRYQGLWQTMSTRAAMTVQKLGWYSKGFVLVFVAHTDNRACSHKRSSFSTAGTTSGSRAVPPWGDAYHIHPNSSAVNRKQIKVFITNESKVSPWIVLLCLLIPIFATFLTALAVLCLFRNRHEWMVDILRDKFPESKTRHSTHHSLLPDPHNHDSTSQDEDDTRTNQPSTAEILLNEILADTRSSLSSLRISRTPATTLKRESMQTRSPCIRWKSDLTISNFKCKKFDEVRKFSKRFYWTITIVAVFYSIPVYQLVIHYLRVLYRTGEYDICYYNYLCAQRLGLLIDFNHFWSNASYVIFGVLFICNVRRRSRNLCLPSESTSKRHQIGNKRERDSGFCCCCRSSSRGDTNTPGKVVQCCMCTFSRICFRWDHGIPAHFGVFYALGVALTMEGVLSAAYHLCPNGSTFQFDTCFMYVIAVLLLLKIYQFRHPIHFGANHTFAILAGFVVLSVVGLVFEQGTDLAILIFKCIFLPIQYVIMVLLGTYYYAVGYVKNEAGENITDWTIFKNLGQLKLRPIHGDRLILPIITLSICVAVLVYTELGKIGFASYLLYILVGNVLGTTIYYVGIMKPLHGEFKNRTWVQPILYFIAAGLIGGWSLQYFVRAPAQWELTASASRAENEDCLTGWFPFHPFYDSHDAWHFLSAAALFLAFMGLLIVDDDLITTPQDQIPVF